MILHAAHLLASFLMTFEHALCGRRILISSCPSFVQPSGLWEQSLSRTRLAAATGAGGSSPSFVLLQWQPITLIARRINLSEDYQVWIIGYWSTVYAPKLKIIDVLCYVFSNCRAVKAIF